MKFHNWLNTWRFLSFWSIYNKQLSRKNSEFIPELNGRSRGYLFIFNSKLLEKRQFENMKERFLPSLMPPFHSYLLLSIWRWDRRFKSHDGSLWNNVRWSIVTFFLRLLAWKIKDTEECVMLHIKVLNARNSLFML